MLRKGDIILIFAVAITITVGYMGIKLFDGSRASGRRIAVIKQDDKVIRKIDLDAVDKLERIAINGSYNEVIAFEKGKIRFEEADCPDKLCVKTGWLSEQGDMAVCLPNRTIVRIEGEPEVDGRTY